MWISLFRSSALSRKVHAKVRVTIQGLLSEIFLVQRMMFCWTFGTKRNFTITSVISLIQCLKFCVGRTQQFLTWSIRFASLSRSSTFQLDGGLNYGGAQFEFSHRIFRHDYHWSAQKQMIEKVVMAANNAGHTCLRGDWNPSRKCHDLLYEGLTLTKWRSVQVLLAWVFMWLKLQVCTESLMFLDARMH